MLHCNMLQFVMATMFHFKCIVIGSDGGSIISTASREIANQHRVSVESEGALQVLSEENNGNHWGRHRGCYQGNDCPVHQSGQARRV